MGLKRGENGKNLNFVLPEFRVVTSPLTSAPFCIPRTPSVLIISFTSYLISEKGLKINSILLNLVNFIYTVTTAGLTRNNF
jgi:hypothetical protein